MSFFSSAAEVPAVTGTDILRKALAARLFKGALGRIAQDYGCGIHELENFACNAVDLPSELKQRLAREFFNCDFDAELDRLRRQPQPEPKSMGVRPPTIAEMNLPRGHLAPRELPQPKHPPPPPQPRPGWAE